MRKLVESTLISLDGVVEAPEQWARFDDEDAEYARAELDHFDAFVMGRVTYQNFYASWGHMTGNPYIERIGVMPKHVASTTLTDTTWNATLLGPDPAVALRALKAQPGKDLIKYGTSRLDELLVREQLIDEIRFWIRPVVAGRGRRLFAGVDADALDLRLTGTTRLDNGSIVLTYVPGRADGPRGT